MAGASASTSVVTSPTPNSTIYTGPVTFQWTAAYGAYYFYLGTQMYGSDLGWWSTNNTYQTVTLSHLGPLYVTLYSIPCPGCNWAWSTAYYNVTTQQTFSATITSPANGSKLITPSGFG